MKLSRLRRPYKSSCPRLFVGFLIMAKVIKITCDKCDAPIPQPDAVETPLQIGFCKQGQALWFYRRALLPYGGHICGACIADFKVKLKELVEATFDSKLISDYETVG